MATAQKWAERAEKNPVGTVFRVVIILAVLIALIGGLGYAFSWFGEAGNVVKEEFGPRNSLVKYEWFKDASNQLEAKQQDIGVYETRLKALEEQYANVQRKDWPRDDREAYNQQTAELAGLKASYNALVAEYNASSEKFNWSYANTEGNIPRSYQTK